MEIKIELSEYETRRLISIVEEFIPEYPSYESYDEDMELIYYLVYTLRKTLNKANKGEK